MASILYLPARSDLEERFHGLLEISVTNKRIEMFHSFEELSCRLHKPYSNVKVAILFAANREEITRILSLGDLLEDIKIILILADGDKDTMMKAHTLRPRYVTWMDCDLHDVVDVFKRMVGLYDSV